MKTANCPTCGSICKVVGNVTMHYEPIGTSKVVKDIIAEHDKEIILLIDERIEAVKFKITDEISSNEYYEWTACIAILMELKNKIEGVAK